MRTFLMSYSSDYESGDDNCPYKPGKSSSSERRTFIVLASVCWYWWRTLVGWPESPTGCWVRHQLGKLLERECTKLVVRDESDLHYQTAIKQIRVFVLLQPYAQLQ